MYALCLFLLPLSFRPGSSIVKVTPITGRSLLFSWHELYKEKGMSHDFETMLGPQTCEEDHYMAFSTNDIVRSLAFCSNSEGESPACVKRVACHPDNLSSASSLIKSLIIDEGYSVNWKTLCQQSRWSMEARMWLSNNS